MAENANGSRRLVTVHLCTVSGVVQRFHRVEKWLFRDGWLVILRDGTYETFRLERRHIGAYATVTGVMMEVYS